MTKDIEVFQPSRWGCQKKVKGLPVFLLPKEEKEVTLSKEPLVGKAEKDCLVTCEALSKNSLSVFDN